MLEKELLFLQGGKLIQWVNVLQYVLNIWFVKDGYVWLVINFGGVYELDEGLNIVFYYLGYVIVLDILFDDWNGIWIFIIERGIYYCGNSWWIFCNQYFELFVGISFL